MRRTSLSSRGTRGRFSGSSTRTVRSTTCSLRSLSTYDDVVSFLEQARAGEQGSILKTIFGGASSELLLTLWLADDSHDEEIFAKQALTELLRLIEARLGLVLPRDISVLEARAKTTRFVLVNEFRHDLAGEPPGSISMIESPPSKEHLGRVREVADALRRGEHAARYAELADQVEEALNLAQAGVEATALGATDTFRFEERLLLRRAIDLTLEGEYEEAIALASDRARSYWIDRDVVRQQQWEACRLAAELGREVARSRERGAVAFRFVRRLGGRIRRSVVRGRPPPATSGQLGCPHGGGTRGRAGDRCCPSPLRRALEADGHGLRRCA